MKSVFERKEGGRGGEEKRLSITVLPHREEGTRRGKQTEGGGEERKGKGCSLLLSVVRES